MGPRDVSILVVDDVQTVRIQVREILREMGFVKILTAQNGLEALTLLNENPVHCVISDWYMAPMNGLELCREMRSKDKLKSIPFILLSAERTRDKVIEAIKSGIDDYIMKPFTREIADTKLINALIKRKVIR